MAQPSVANYFNSRKRSAVDDLNAKLVKKVATELDRDPKTVHVNVILPNKAKQYADELPNNDTERSTTVAEILQQNKLQLAKKIQEKSATKKVASRKTTRIRKLKESQKLQDIQSVFLNMKKDNMQLQESTVVKDDIVEIEHKTPPSSPIKNNNIMDKVLGQESGLSLNDLRLKMCRSNRLTELKASINRLKASQVKLDKIEEKTCKVLDSPVLKTFKTIELEVQLSPQKLLSPEKAYLSPRKDSSARKNLLSLLSPTKNAVSLAAKSSVSKQLFQTPSNTALLLPYKYRCAAEMFRCIDTVCQIMHNRKETITFRRLKPAVEEMVKRNVYEKHLAQILTIYPEAFHLKQEKIRVFGTGAKTEQWELVVTPTITQASMTADVLIERRRIFSSTLTDQIKTYHDEYLASLDPPMTVDRNKITRWHPEFDIERVPDIEEAALPQEVTEERFATGKEVLARAKVMFNCNTRMEQAMKRLQEKQAAATASGEVQKTDFVKTQPESLLKGIPAALLEKVRQRQAAKALETMTRSDSKEKELQLYGRLPDMCRLTRNLFVTEKKSVLPLDIVLNKLENSMRSYLTRKDLEQHLRVAAKEFPKWLVFHEIRATVFVKICKATDLSIIISKLEKIIKDKTDS